MERITPWVPLFSRVEASLTSARVGNFSFDASMPAPALQRITVGGAP
jgi:hypothetical protein